MSWRDDHDGSPDAPKSRRASRGAQYVRMSTEHQRYSTENQSDAIAQYAEQRGIDIVRTYSDEGKSGLRIKGRDGLKQLIEPPRIYRRLIDRSYAAMSDLSRAA